MYLFMFFCFIIFYYHLLSHYSCHTVGGADAVSGVCHSEEEEEAPIPELTSESAQSFSRERVCSVW